VNTFIHAIALVLSLYFSWWLFDRGQGLPGIAMMGVALVLIVWTIQAALEDAGDIKGPKKRGRR
jgi:hypothetical protein